MYMEDVRVPYQFPAAAAFGDQWDHHFINGGGGSGVPAVFPNITHQYFDYTRQAAASAGGGGGEGGQYNHQYHHHRHSNYYYADHSDQQYRFQQPTKLTDYNPPAPPPQLTIYRIPGSTMEAPKRIHSFKEPRKLCRVCDAVPEPPIKPHLSSSRPDLYEPGLPNPKAVDEDLYKIPPEYLRKNRRGAKLLSFFSKVFRFRPHFGC